MSTDVVRGYRAKLMPYYDDITIDTETLSKILEPFTKKSVATGCPYCEDTTWCMSDLEYGKEIEAINSRSNFAHVARDPETDKFYFEINDLLFEINFCPKCGRKLVEE